MDLPRSQALLDPRPGTSDLDSEEKGWPRAETPGRVNRSPGEEILVRRSFAVRTSWRRVRPGPPGHWIRPGAGESEDREASGD